MNNYVCVISTDDYIEGVLVINENLKKMNSTHDLICLINEKISEKTKQLLDYFHIQYRIIPSIIYENNTFDRWNYTFDKLNIFALTEYDKLVYIDSDMLILQNIDELFSINTFALASDQPFTDKGNSAVMVIKPNKKNHEELLNIVKKYIQEKRDFVGDQNIINDYFKNNRMILPLSYNQMKGIELENNELCVKVVTPPVSEPKIIHFLNQPKLFMLKDRNIEVDQYTKIYSSYLKKVREKIQEFEKNNL